MYTAAPRNNIPLTTSIPVTEDLVGTFVCEARNAAGLGELCEISVSNPVAALAGVEGSNGHASGEKNEINYTYIAFGGGAVIALVFAVSLLSILICRKRYGFSGTKYSLDNFKGTPGERNGEDDDIATHESANPTSALINQCANTHTKHSSRGVRHNVLHGKHVPQKLNRS